MNSIGVDFKLKNVDVDNARIKLQIWDTAGQERFRTITTSYYKGAHAILIVYDITDKESFDHVKNWMADIDKFAKQGVIRILVGNKCDLEHKRAVPKENGKELADKCGIKFVETSAKDTVNIEELFIDTAKFLLAKQTQINNNKSINKNSGSVMVGVNLSGGDENIKQSSKGYCC